MRTANMRPHWAVVATLSVLTIAGCPATVPSSTQSGATAAGTGATVDSAGAGKPAMGAPIKAGSATAAGNGAAAVAGASAPAGSAGDGSAATGTSPAAKAGSAGADVSAAAAAGTSASAATPTKPKNPNAIPACEGKNNEGACDGAKLYFCIDEAPDGAGESCMSAAMCQVGLKTGKCGMCEPGKFHCDAKDLQKCDDTGQWMLAQTCDSELLCKESKGRCDDKICSKDEFKCIGDELKTCNESLTDLMLVKSCDKGLCNEMGKKCNECDPMISKACASSSSLTLCSMDGVKSSMDCPANKKFCVADKKDCFECVTAADCGKPASDCGTMACTDNKCVAGPSKPAETPCTMGGKVCDYLGACVACVSDADCGNSQLTCLTGVACVNKNPISSVTPSFLSNGWTIVVTPGYEVTVSSPGIPSSFPSLPAEAIQTISLPTGDCVPALSGLALPGSTVMLRYGTTGTPTMTDPNNPFPPDTCTGTGGTITLTATAKK